MSGVLPGKSGWDTNWRSGGNGKKLQIVQVEELYLPQTYVEPACCSPEMNSWLSRGLSIPKFEYFGVLQPVFFFFVLVALGLPQAL